VGQMARSSPQSTAVTEHRELVALLLFLVLLLLLLAASHGIASLVALHRHYGRFRGLEEATDMTPCVS